jgi:hypothetical protein
MTHPSFRLSITHNLLRLIQLLGHLFQRRLALLYPSFSWTPTDSIISTDLP